MLSPQAKEVEQLIWKAVHYRPIEEFRNRLRIAGQAVLEASSASQPPSLGPADAKV